MAARFAACLIMATACSSSAPKSTTPPTTEPVAAPADAAVDSAPDAGPPQAVLDAPPWIFRYSTKDRVETWTLRTADGGAVIDVETKAEPQSGVAAGTQRYVGTATQTSSLVVDVATPTAKLHLDCKPEKRAYGTKCNDAKAAKIDVLECFHPDFKTPMPFGHAPGIEYVVDASCNGYRLVAP